MELIVSGSILTIPAIKKVVLLTKYINIVPRLGIE